MSGGATPKVSVVVTTYRRAKRLPPTLDSILGQGFRDFELILSDDCSPDETPAVGEEYASRDPRVRYVRNETNLGMPGNLNAAIARARGEYVANLHDDDIYRADLLDRWVGLLDRHPGAAFVFNQYEKVGLDGRRRILELDMPECMPGREFLRRFFVKQWGSPIFGTVMARRRCYEEVGPFDSRFWMHADVDMWVRLAARYDVAYVAEPLITINPREPDHILKGRYLWEVTADTRCKRSAMAILYPDRPFKRAAFELRARLHYAWNAIAPLRRGRWRDAFAVLRLAAGASDVQEPPVRAGAVSESRPRSGSG